MRARIGGLIFLSLLLTTELWADEAAVLAEIRALRRDVQELSAALRETRVTTKDDTSVSETPKSADVQARGGPGSDIAEGVKLWNDPDAYQLEPSDEIWLEVSQLVPSRDYKINVGDELEMTTSGSFETPEGIYVRDLKVQRVVTVSLEGTITIGSQQKAVKIEGLTTSEASREIKRVLAEPQQQMTVTLTVMSMRGRETVNGKQEIRPDGSINLGQFGRVYVSGMTLTAAQDAIKAHLANYVQDPIVVAKMWAMNSKVCFIVIEDPLNGDRVQSYGLKGNETVLDALATFGGLSQVSSIEIYLMRLIKNESYWALPVDIDGITRNGDTETNYQLLPGDRLFIRHWK